MINYTSRISILIINTNKPEQAKQHIFTSVINNKLLVTILN